MSTWLALVLTDVVAVTTFARCYTGPGELTAALMTLLAVHLTCLAARRGLPRSLADARRAIAVSGNRDEGLHEPGGSPGQKRRVGARGGWWTAAGLAAVLLPVGIVLGSLFFSMGLDHTVWHTVRTDLWAGWNAFSLRTAPVPELPALVLVTAWASGATGLIAELVHSRRKLPAVFALAPAFGIYLLASALGTGHLRVLGLACMAGSACWYLVATVRENESARGVLFAWPDSARNPGTRKASRRAVAMTLRMALLAAIAAAVIGPNLPGAHSPALVTFSGGTRLARTTATTILPPSGNLADGIEVSSLVQVAQREIDDSTTALFTVFSSVPTRELVTTLDEFNGNSWSNAEPGPRLPLGTFSLPANVGQQPAKAPVPDGPGHEKLLQVFEVAGLGGYEVPAWGDPLLVESPVSQMTWSPTNGSVLANNPIQPGSVYAVSSIVPDPSPSQLEAAVTDTSDPQNLQLPGPVPAQLLALADSIVTGASTPYQKALDLDAYLTSPRFHYQLPRLTSSAVVATVGGYGDLLNFLFASRTGYCQQFATAFAVLARIDGLPTRIAVGFLPGTPIGNDEWQVDGNDTHAWPQVLFEGYGWIDFEPTPGTTSIGSSTPGVSVPTTTTPPVTTTHRRTPNLRPSPTGGVKAQRSPKPVRSHRSNGSDAPWLLILPVAIVAWIGGVPAWRRMRLRHARREPRAGVLAAWNEALRTVDLVGIRRRRAETYMELARRIVSAGALSPEAEPALKDLARLATTATYAAAPPADCAVRQAMSDAKVVVRYARQRADRWQRVAAALDPRALPA
jgi:transglutaminase-like putative cysteine protease